MAEDDPGERLNLDIGHRGALRLGKAADLGLCEVDIGHVSRRHLVHRRVDLGLCQPERRRRKLVELFRQIAHSRIAPRLDILQRGLHDGADFGVVF